tara:strand:+ start:949 stop:1227 length:279 start_codon:yes stop_codon:yes gene_type:complete
VDDEIETKESRFQVGDVVIEGTLIATLEKSPMIGIVIKVEPDYFSLNEHYIIFGELEKRIQDRLVIQWITDPYIESLPEELVDLISRNSDEK